MEGKTATAKPSSVARGWPRLRSSLCTTLSSRWNMPSMRQRGRYSAAIRSTLIASGRLLHSRMAGIVALSNGL